MLKSLKSFLFTAVFAVGLCLATAGAANAAYCAWYWPPPINTCGGWVPDPPSGWVNVSNTYTPAAGEFVGCEASNTYCVKAAIGPGGFWGVGNLQDYAYSSGWGWQFKTIKSRMARTVDVCNGYNWTGSCYSYNSGGSLYTVTLPGGYNPNSVYLRN